MMRTVKRVKQLGEVFTPPELVNEMLNKLPPETWTDHTKTMADTCGCGNGAFLVEVIKRKIEGGSTPIQALSTTFGIDIMQDNVDECRARMLKQAEESSGQTRADEWVVIVSTNIVCGDALKYDWDKHPAGENKPEAFEEMPPKKQKLSKQHAKASVAAKENAAGVHAQQQLFIAARRLGISERVLRDDTKQVILRSCETKGKGKLEDIEEGTVLNFIERLKSNDEIAKLTGHVLKFMLPDGREIMMHSGHVRQL
jgi:hypothetical protein